MSLDHTGLPHLLNKNKQSVLVSNSSEILNQNDIPKIVFKITDLQ